MMFGRMYANYPEVLLDSYRSMAPDNRRSPLLVTGLSKFLFKIYISMFGIPEIGFQMRGRYFFRTISNLNSFIPKTILDAGCGVGAYTFVTKNLFPNSKIAAIDMDDFKLKSARKILKDKNIAGISFTKKDLTTDLGYNKYDLIINIDVLEHIKDYRLVLKNFYRALKPDGFLYIHTPQTKQQRIFKNFFINWSHEEHVREGFELSTFVKNLETLGFKRINYHGGFGLFGKLAWELNTLFLSFSPILMVFFYPLFYLIACIDSIITIKPNLTLFVIAKK